ASTANHFTAVLVIVKCALPGWAIAELQDAAADHASLVGCQICDEIADFTCRYPFRLCGSGAGAWFDEAEHDLVDAHRRTLHLLHEDPGHHELRRGIDSNRAVACDGEHRRQAAEQRVAGAFVPGEQRQEGA